MDEPSEFGSPFVPDDAAFYEILEDFEDEDGDLILLVREAAATEATAMAVEEIFDAFGNTQIFVLPTETKIDRSTRLRVASRMGIDLAAVATARREYDLMMSFPGEGHLKALGEALDRIFRD